MNDYGDIIRRFVWAARKVEQPETPKQLQERAKQLREIGFTVEYLDGGHLAIGAAARFAL